MINSDLTDFVTGHYFRMCSFVQVEKHDLHGASAINTAEAGTGAPDVVYPQKRGIRTWVMDRITVLSSEKSGAESAVDLHVSQVIFCNAFPTRGWQTCPSCQRCSRQLPVLYLFDKEDLFHC